METREFKTGRTAFYRFEPKGKPLAAILMIHGLGEHAGRYAWWAGKFNDAGIAFISFDLPGHGMAEGRRGVMPPYGELYKTIDLLLSEMRNDYPAVPLFLYGHSLGGGIVLNYLIKNRPEIRGAIVTSPWIRLTETPPRYKVLLASVVKSVMPGMTQPSGLKTEFLSHDPEVVNLYRTDELVHGLISVGLYNSAIKAAEESLERAGEISVPLLIAHGRDDMITSPSGSVDIASAAPHATLKLWDGGYHELHNDLMKEEHFEFITDWINTLL